MFIDFAEIKVKAGNGGDGAISFRRERCVPAGGPDGGDGGKGGDVLFVADDCLSTLADFRYKRKYIAESGKNGGSKNCSGRSGDNLLVKVPRGTVVRELATGEIIADIVSDDFVVIAKGGAGGYGNSHFAKSTRQSPRFAKPGFLGEELEVSLELKLLADVGLVGLPNVGKSSLISVISSAKPKIGNYNFTTLVPNLGVVRVSDGESFVVADIPGLIEGASAGAGLGHKFLRHVQRCRLLLHMVDVSCQNCGDVVENVEVVNNELFRFDETLLKRRQFIVASKSDVADRRQVEKLMAYAEKCGFEFFEISSVTGSGLKNLVGAVYRELETIPKFKEQVFNRTRVVERDRRSFEVEVVDGVFFVDAPWLERIIRVSDMESFETLKYFQKIVKHSGIEGILKQRGIKEGDMVYIGSWKFEFLE